MPAYCPHCRAELSLLEIDHILYEVGLRLKEFRLAPKSRWTPLERCPMCRGLFDKKQLKIHLKLDHLPLKPEE